jgi:hypothetical protein
VERRRVATLSHDCGQDRRLRCQLHSRRRPKAREGPDCNFLREGFSTTVYSLQQATRIVRHLETAVAHATKGQDQAEDIARNCEVASRGGVALMWWINFRRGSEVIGVAIIEASSIFHARTRLAVCGIGRPVDYSDGKEVDARCAALIPRNSLGRLLLPDEALKLGRSLLTEHTPAAQRRH